jgi:hypothetical protein
MEELSGILDKPKEQIRNLLDKYFIRDMNEWEGVQADLMIDKELIEKIIIKANKVYEIRKEIEHYAQNTMSGKVLEKIIDEVNIDLLKNRVKAGKAKNALFSDTILYLLKKEGPLSTKEMNPMIQIMHPDICYDSIDRVINGQNFGKKWKPLVRDSKQYLKKRGLIFLKNNKWHIAKK